MKVLVYGAGPLGSLLAARLHTAGENVSLLARGRRLADIREHGVVLEDAFSGEQEIARVNVVETLEPDDAFDLILVVMRKDQSEAILPALAANRHAQTIVFMQNNAAGFARYVATLGTERVMAGFPTAGGERRDPVMRVMALNAVAMPVGEIDGRVIERTRAVADLLRKTGKRVQIRRDMDAWLVSHVPSVAVFGGLYAAELDPARFARTPDAMLLGVRARAEALRAQPAAGIPVSPAWFRVLPWIPEPVAVGMLRVMAGQEFFEVGVVAHSRAAREELAHLLSEYRQRIAPGGTATPSLDAIGDHIAGRVSPFPDGSDELRMDWRGMLAGGLALATLGALAVIRRRG